MVTINLTPRNLLPRHPWTSKLSHCSGGSCLANCWKASLAGRPRTTDPLRVSPVAKFMWRKCGKTRGKYMVKMIYIYIWNMNIWNIYILIWNIYEIISMRKKKVTSFNEMEDQLDGNVNGEWGEKKRLKQWSWWLILPKLEIQLVRATAGQITILLGMERNFYHIGRGSTNVNAVPPNSLLFETYLIILVNPAMFYLNPSKCVHDSPMIHEI